MRSSDRPTKKKAERKNEAHVKPKDNSVTNTVTLDNYTMVEVLKHLNYCQLASSSLVSKRYRDVIQKNRHKLALLKVDYIGMKFVVNDHDYIKMFDTVLTPEAYKKWVIRNHYLRQIPLESQINETQITQFYQLWACTNYKDPNYSNDSTTVFYANAELSREGWPLFLHFARLLTDPFIYIRDLELISQNVLNLLAEAIKPDQNGVKCDNLRLNLRDNSHAIFKWIKDYVLCNEFQIYTEFESVSNYGEEFLDLFMTGANCTSKIWAGNFDLCDVVVVFVQVSKVF
ncbi:hypothetical protein Ddc_13552 [Ditylenchus destructor]|nr:hypothetical protein Ddc_13552 [Ditylenchus destructor]